MNCIIVDDEPLAREEMQAQIKEVSKIEILGKFSNARSALEFLKENDVDLIFLDIEMPMVTGLEFAAQLPQKTLIIFTTAYSQYALDSYELDAIDYLLKPIDKDRLDKSISKAEMYRKMLSNDTEKSIVEGETADFLMIKSERKFHRVRYSDIKYIEGLKDYVVIYTVNQKLITAINLKNIHQRMPQDIFLRVSKSYIVNTDYVESFDHHSIFIGEYEISLGDIYKKEFFSIFSKGTLNIE